MISTDNRFYYAFSQSMHYQTGGGRLKRTNAEFIERILVGMFGD